MKLFPNIFVFLYISDHNSKVWCQIAYWEMAHRVGEFFNARTKAVNIYTDGIVGSQGDSMCLRDLAPAGKQVQSEQVQTTRQKVGLGKKEVCLSWWAHVNRSTHCRGHIEPGERRCLDLQPWKYTRFRGFAHSG